MGQPVIHCKYDLLIDPSKLKYHPKNRNKHPREQIERLADVIEYQGWRYAIKISNLSGYVTTGHGRIAAAFLKKWGVVPVVYQDYESKEQEYADVQADNAIAAWAELDYAGINLDIGDLGPDLDINMLGLKSFFIDASERTDPNKEWTGMPEFTQEDKTAYKSIVVHFHDQDAVEKFRALMKQPITEKTRMMWYPEMRIERASDKRYGSE